MTKPFKARRGVALFAALALTAIVGLLVSGIVTSTRLARRGANSAHTDARLAAAADFALLTIAGGHRARGLADLPLGRPRVLDNVPTGDVSIDATVSATRLPHDLLWLVAEARPRSTWTAKRRVNLIARWHPMGGLPGAAIVSRGNVRLGPGVNIHADSTGEADCRVDQLGAQLIVGESAVVKSADTVRVQQAQSADDSLTYFLSAVQRARLNNASAIVRVGHDTTISNGRFDGVLLIDGGLAITGAFTGSGLIVARGAIDARAATVSFDGALMSFAPASDESFAVDLGAGTLRFSPCEIAHAIRRTMPLRAVRARSWSEMF
jgi:hypothetical protein